MIESKHNQSGWRLMRDWVIRLDGYLLREPAREPYEAYVNAYNRWTERYPYEKVTRASVEGVGWFVCPPT